LPPVVPVRPWIAALICMDPNEIQTDVMLSVIGCIWSYLAGDGTAERLIDNLPPTFQVGVKRFMLTADIEPSAYYLGAAERLYDDDDSSARLALLGDAAKSVLSEASIACDAMALHMLRVGILRDVAEAEGWALRWRASAAVKAIADQVADRIVRVPWEPRAPYRGIVPAAAE